jgi:hypothetical protein
MYGKFGFTSRSHQFELVAVQIAAAQGAACLYTQGQPRVAVLLNHRKGYRNLGPPAGLLGKVVPSGLIEAFAPILHALARAVSRLRLPNGHFP